MIKEGLFQSKQGLETLKERGHALSCQGGAVKIPLNYCRARPLQVKSLFAQFFVISHGILSTLASKRLDFSTAAAVLITDMLQLSKSGMRLKLF